MKCIRKCNMERDVICDVEFSKVSILFNMPYGFTIVLTFENFILGHALSW